MGFGSYDESDQEQPTEDDGPDGIDYTERIKGQNSDADGDDETTDESTEDMMKHLR